MLATTKSDCYQYGVILLLMLATSLMRTLLVYAESTAADVSNLVSALSEALGPETDAELHNVPKVYIRCASRSEARPASSGVMDV